MMSAGCQVSLFRYCNRYWKILASLWGLVHPTLRAGVIRLTVLVKGTVLILEGTACERDIGMKPSLGNECTQKQSIVMYIRSYSSKSSHAGNYNNII